MRTGTVLDAARMGHRDDGPPLLAVLVAAAVAAALGGPELADRLDVTVRTVRRDVDRLRQLGYPVESTAGDDRRLRPRRRRAGDAAADARPGRGRGRRREPALDRRRHDRGRRRRRRLGRWASSSCCCRRRCAARSARSWRRPSSSARRPTPVSPDVLVAVRRACRDSERLRVTYRNAGGVVSERTLDPHRLVRTARRWYLVARDRDRDAWRTLRIDRLATVRPTGHRVVHRRSTRCGGVGPAGDLHRAVPLPAASSSRRRSTCWPGASRPAPRSARAGRRDDDAADDGQRRPRTRSTGHLLASTSASASSSRPSCGADLEADGRRSGGGPPRP